MNRTFTKFVGGFLLTGLLFAGSLMAQVWSSNGEFGLKLKSYGELEVYSPVVPTDTIYQIDRLSPVVGISPDSLFDYRVDADDEIEPMVVTPPAWGDMELFSAINNLYSLEPPDVLIKISVYGWNTGKFGIVKYNVKNRETHGINAVVGMEVIPELDEDYAGTSAFDDGLKAAVFSRGDSIYAGVKFLSSDITSGTFFYWYSSYDSDKPRMYSWLTADSLGFVNTYGADGGVAVIGQPRVRIAAGDSTELTFAVAVGDSMAELSSGLSEAVTLYHAAGISSTSNVVPEEFSLAQNFPNPFNPTTKINFSVPTKDHVTLKVFNMLGQQVATLVNSDMATGDYEVNFAADNLPSGIYFYTLQTRSFKETRKMILMR